MVDSETRAFVLFRMQNLKKKVKLHKFLEQKFGANADLTGLDVESFDLSSKVKDNID